MVIVGKRKREIARRNCYENLVPGKWVSGLVSFMAGRRRHRCLSLESLPARPVGSSVMATATTAKEMVVWCEWDFFLFCRLLQNFYGLQNLVMRSGSLVCECLMRSYAPEPGLFGGSFHDYSFFFLESGSLANLSFRECYLTGSIVKVVHDDAASCVALMKISRESFHQTICRCFFFFC